jgi:RimJ/RimL family protein N-acetyltransferase
MELRSARLSVRGWTLHDDELADEWPSYNDPFEPLWNLPRQLGLSSDAWSVLDSWTNRRTWAVDDRAGRLIGRISLREIDARRAEARLGITFGAPYIGQGLGTEALALFLDYYFTDFGFAAMLLDVAAPNERAVRSYRHLGFRHVADDWRLADSRFDRRLLDSPRYADLRRFFRIAPRGLEVAFYEMRLDKADWFAGRGRQSQHAH